MKRLLILILLMLAGCATDPRIVAFEAGKKKVNVDTRVLYECPDLPMLTGTSDEDQLKALQAWFNQYKECRTWKHELNRIVKDAFNTGK